MSAVAAVALCVVAGAVFISPKPISNLPWEYDPGAVFERARAENRLILVSIHSGACPPCRRMDRETFASPDVTGKARGFELLRIDVDARPELAARYGASMTPTVLVLTPEDKIVARGVGFLDPAELIALLDAARERATAVTGTGG